MKMLIVLLLISFAHAENLTPEEQKALIEENKMLREQIKKQQATPPQDSAKMMEALKKGQKHQNEQNKVLEELDKEE